MPKDHTFEEKQALEEEELAKMLSKRLKTEEEKSNNVDTQALRHDFPILERKVNGHPLIYFDNAATTQKPRQVIDAKSDFYSNHNANVHRAVHTLSKKPLISTRSRAKQSLGSSTPKIGAKSSLSAVQLKPSTWWRILGATAI